MPLVAEHPVEDGVWIHPFTKDTSGTEIVRGRCGGLLLNADGDLLDGSRCRAVMIARHGGDRAVDHWFHEPRPDGSGCTSQGKTDWHHLWQQAAPADRREVKVNVGGRKQWADIRTSYDWTIELQHSPIQQATVRDRQDGRHGRVLWLIDGTDARNGAIEEVSQDGRDLLRWTAAPRWVHPMTTPVAVHAGPVVHLLPPLRKHWGFHRGDIYFRAWDTLDIAAFIATYINGASNPYVGATTQWDVERHTGTRAGQGKPRPRQSEPTEPDGCRYTGGDRGRLVQADTPPATTSGDVALAVAIQQAAERPASDNTYGGRIGICHRCLTRTVTIPAQVLWLPGIHPATVLCPACEARLALARVDRLRDAG